MIFFQLGKFTLLVNDSQNTAAMVQCTLGVTLLMLSAFHVVQMFCDIRLLLVVIGVLQEFFQAASEELVPNDSQHVCCNACNTSQIWSPKDGL